MIGYLLAPDSGGEDKQTQRHTDIMTYRFNRPRGRLSEKKKTELRTISNHSDRFFQLWHCTTPNSTALYFTVLHFTALSVTVLHYTTLHFPVQHLSALQYGHHSPCWDSSQATEYVEGRGGEGSRGGRERRFNNLDFLKTLFLIKDNYPNCHLKCFKVVVTHQNNLSAANKKK